MAPTKGGPADAADPRFPSSAPELGRSRRGDRLVCAAVPELHQGRMGRLPGAAVAQQRDGAVHQGGPAAAVGAAERDLAFRLACHRRAQEPRRLPGARRGEAAAALHDGRRRLGAGEQRHLAERRRRARPDAGADRRGAGQGRAAAGRRRVRLHGGAGQCAGRVRRRLSGRAVQPRAPVAGGAAVRAALVSEAPECAGARGLRRPAADRGGLQGAARRRPHLAGAQPRGDVPHRRGPGSSSATWC